MWRSSGHPRPLGLKGSKSKRPGFRARAFYFALFVGLKSTPKASAPNPSSYPLQSFHILNVSPSLRQYMMQIVPHADERKSLIQKLADPRSPKQENSKNDLVFPASSTSFA